MHEEPRVGLLRRDLLEHADELLPDRLALLLGVGDAGEPLEEPVRGLDVHEGHLEMAAERILDLLGLSLTKEPGVHEHAREAVADGLVDEERSDGAVHPAGERTQHLLRADLLADALHRALDHAGGRPVREQAACLVEEALHDVEPAVRMRDLRMELHAEEPALAILHRGDRRHLRRGGDAEPGRRALHGVGMAHPDRLAVREVLQEHAGLLHEQVGGAVLAGSGRLDVSPERLRHQLLAVADAEHRDAELEDARVDRGSSLLVDRCGAPGEHEPRRTARAELHERDVEGNDLRVDVALPHTAGDQLRVLRSEVQDEDRPGFLRDGAHAMPTPWAFW